jgi:hypothetical protein
MGEVYRARDTRLDRTVAIKVLPDHVRGDPALRERFEREARTVAALNHPHICTLYDVGHQDGTEFIVLEHLEGETLAERLATGPLPLDEALAIGVQVADALSKAHKAGVVHRDLKPANIMLTKSGARQGSPQAKLLDFGLAKMTGAVVAASGLSAAPTGVTPVTMHGTILGTLQYMAPEQIEGQEADARADLFAFGCVLYEMVVGKPAFHGKTQASLIGAILKDTPPPMNAVQPLTPLAMERVVSACLAKNPDERWQTARDVLRELQWMQTTAQSQEPAVSSRRGPAWLAWSIAAASLLLVAAAGIGYLSRAPQPAAEMRVQVMAPAGPVTSFALSPDGQKLVFAADGQLWLRALDSEAARPLAGTDNGLRPFWSPDGRSFAFIADDALKRFDIGSGAVQALAAMPLMGSGTWGLTERFCSKLAIPFIAYVGLRSLPTQRVGTRPHRQGTCFRDFCQMAVTSFSTLLARPNDAASSWARWIRSRPIVCSMRIRRRSSFRRTISCFHGKACSWRSASTSSEWRRWGCHFWLPIRSAPTISRPATSRYRLLATERSPIDQ